MDLNLSDHEKALLLADRRKTERVGLWMVAFIIPCFIAVGIVCWHGLVWLRTGEWPSLSLGDALEIFGVRISPTFLIGLDKIVDWVVRCPLAGVLPTISIGLLYIFNYYDRQPDSDALKTARMKDARRTLVEDDNAYR